ncbi:Protein of unknown function [Pyronema omphalodes CBS 100304]|uniref:Uncharacterized protein n=1 Tax=Pyronema omphalodes (strain CBS 100304) TaxID=1076935 RepID=U4L2Q7_PYROM|nr:Protein of unknown function [Pyronema omphalodes CBS 100304]
MHISPVLFQALVPSPPCRKARMCRRSKCRFLLL